MGAAQSDCKAPRSIREFSSKFRVTAKGALKSPHNIAGPQTPSKRKRAHSRTLQFTAYRSDPSAQGKRYTRTMWTGTCPHCKQQKWIRPPSQTLCVLHHPSKVLWSSNKRTLSFLFQKIIGPCVILGLYRNLFCYHWKSHSSYHRPLSPFYYLSKVKYPWLPSLYTGWFLLGILIYWPIIIPM